MKNPFLSLKYRNFRIYWVGMNVSLIGSWMQTIALPWLTLTITGDPFKVSLVAVSQFIPPLFLTLFYGALLDKFNKKLLLSIAQIGMASVAALFTIMVFSGQENFNLILILSLVHGIFMSFDAPSRQSMIYDLIDNKCDLPNAIALNSMSFNVARILGPSIAGFIMAVFGVAWCFLINAISFFAVLISLKFIKFRPDVIINHTGKLEIWRSIKEGFLYVLNKKILLEGLCILLIVATFIPNYNVTISAFVKFVLEGDETTFGYLISSVGVGAFFGALFVAVFGKLGSYWIYVVSFFTAIILSFMSLFENFYIICFLVILTGFGFVIVTASTNSMIQLNTKNEFRGRVMSIYTFVFQGSTPFGAMFAGYFIERYGAKFGFFISGAAAFLLLLMIIFCFKNKMRRK